MLKKVKSLFKKEKSSTQNVYVPKLKPKAMLENEFIIEKVKSVLNKKTFTNEDRIVVSVVDIEFKIITDSLSFRSLIPESHNNVIITKVADEGNIYGIMKVVITIASEDDSLEELTLTFENAYLDIHDKEIRVDAANLIEVK